MSRGDAHVRVGLDPLLEKRDNPRAFKIEWAAQRIAYAVFSGILLGAGLGFFGGGGVLGTVKEHDGGAQVEYERFARKTSGTELVVRVDRVEQERMRVRLSRDIAEGLDREAVLPGLERTAAGDAVLEYAATPGRAFEARIPLRHREMGRVGGEVEVGGHVLPLWVMVFP